MSKSIDNQIYRIIKSHHETGHVRIGNRNRFTLFHLFYPEGDYRATAGHHIAVTSTANGSLRILSKFTPLGNGYLFHQCFGNTHGVDGISRLVSGQADNTLNTGVNSGVQHVIRTDDVGLNGLHGEELAGRNLLQSSSMEDVINTGHCVTDRLRIADIADIELYLLGVLRVLGLKLMAHIILLLFITREDTDLLQVRIQEVLQNGRTKRTSTTSDHKGCVIKCRHNYSPFK